MTLNVIFTLNGAPMSVEIEPPDLLVDVLRDRLGLTGTKRSCEVQVCGACTVLVDGAPVSSCCTLAYDVAGRDVLTIEGFAESPEFVRFESAFTRHAAMQCGFCTPGLVLTIKSLLESGDLGDEEEIKRALGANLCRCTGYRSILEAVAELAEA